MAPRNASAAVGQSLARRARTPRLYSLSALGAAGGWRTGSAEGVLGSASVVEGASASTNATNPTRRSLATIAPSLPVIMRLAYRAPALGVITLTETVAGPGAPRPSEGRLPCPHRSSECPFRR